MGKLSRTKGHNWEREVAGMLREWGFPGARRHLEYQDGEANGVDIAGILPLLAQCKCTAGPMNPLRVLGEIQTPGLKTAFIKTTNKGWYVALSPESAEWLFRLAAEQIGK